MFKYFTITLLLLISQAAFSNTQCFMVKNLNDNKIITAEGNCEERFTPASTFKIPLSLMGFDSAIFTSETKPTWAYEEKYAESAWGEPCKVPQNPASWIKNSCVWYSQILTQKLGKEKFQHYVNAFNYGNKDVSGDIGKDDGLSRAWLGSSLKISPKEQVEFISNLLRNQLPVSNQSQTLTQHILYAEDLSNGWKMYGKTGMVYERDNEGIPNSERHIGWYVGWISKGDEQLVFAALIVDNQNQTESASMRAKQEAKQRLTKMITIGLGD
ncbi:MAG: class D beta-lactamase [Gammaproteobacteria bacterium]|jgi:beta-lactamase class D